MQLTEAYVGFFVYYVGKMEEWVSQIPRELKNMDGRDQQLKERRQKRMQENCHEMRRIELLFHAGLFASVSTLEESKPREYELVGSDPEESDLEESESEPEESEKDALIRAKQEKFEEWRVKQ